MLKSCVLWLTYRCNYKCPYCGEWGKAVTFPSSCELTAKAWLSFFNGLPPITIDVTGGEPALHPGFYELLDGLKYEHKIGVTTNLAVLDIDRMPDRELSVTVSFHPSQKMNVQEFVDKALALKTMYRNVTVNYVAYPRQVNQMPTYARLFKSKDLRFHVDSDQNMEIYTGEQQNVLKPYLSGDRSLGRSEFEKYKRFCTAGYEHVHFLPNGVSKRCYYQPDCLGTVPDINLFSEPKTCEPNYCGGCDRDSTKQWRV